MAAAPPRVERTRSEASLGSASPHSTKSPRKEATDAAAEIVPFDRPDAIAAITSLLPRKSDEIFNFKPPPRRQETVSVPPRG